jgi:Holliday junction resolvasome RuvABC ATP-dependent DNA helicase subunit
MEVKKILLEQHNTIPAHAHDNRTTSNTGSTTRPLSFADFVGQDDIVSMVQTAITSAQKSDHTL